MNEYKDYRHVIQNTSALYVGAKFNFQDIVKEEEVPFKFRTIMSRYILPEVDGEDTFESVIYYLQPEGFVYEVFLQLRTKVRTLELTRVKPLFGKEKYIYKEHLYTMAELAAIPKEEKERMGIVIQEIQFSKLAIMAFSV